MPRATQNEAAEAAPLADATPFPLSSMQEGLVYHSLLAPGSGVYVQQVVCRTAERLDAALLRGAWADVLDRVDALRTRLHLGVDGGTPQQSVAESVELPFVEVDLRGLNAADVQARLAAHLAADRVAPLDLGEAPLMRVGLFRIDGPEDRLVWTFHHVILDAASRLRVLAQVLAAYDARRSGALHPAPEAPPLRGGLEAIARRAAAASADFWSRALDGFDAPTSLPGEGSAAGRPEGQAPGRGRVAMRLSADAVRALSNGATGHGVSVATLVQAAWALTLARYGGREDVTFGVTRSGRRSAGIGDDAIGLFIDTVPVRTLAAADRPVAEVLNELRSLSRATFEHEHTPLVDIEACAPLAPGVALFETVVDFMPYREGARLAALAPGPGGRDVEVHEQPHYPLVLKASVDGDLLLEFSHDRSRVGAEAAERVLAHVDLVLGAFAGGGLEGRVGELPALTEREQEELASGEVPTRPYPRGVTVQELFAEQVRLAPPERVAVVAGAESLTYADLDRRAAILADRLGSLGVDRGATVGVALERSPEAIVALLAVLRVGAAYLPVEPGYPVERLRLMLVGAGASVVLACGAAAGRLRAAELDGVVVVDGPGSEPQATTATAPEDSQPAAVSAEDVAYVMHTSGSTGVPKAVEVPHRAIVRLARGADYVALGPEEVVLAAAPLGFDASTFEIWGALLNGARLVLHPPEAPSPDGLAELLRAHGVTTLWLTAGLFHLLVEHRPDALHGVRQLLAGGEVLSPSHVSIALEALPPAGVLVNGYGPTENTTFTCVHPMPAGSTVDGPVPIGRPVPGTTAHVLDTAGRRVPVGAVGELFAGGDGVALGYRGDDAGTAARFVPDPFVPDPSARLYRTGDVVRQRADGVLEFLGRADRQVKLRGFRIEPAEVERALDRCADVASSVVLVREDRPGDRRLVAYLVPARGRTPERSELRRALLGRLPDHMVPSAFVAVDALPLTANGKVDHGALPAPEGERRAASRRSGPSGTLERSIAREYAEVLGVPSVDGDDGFFELGGNSLLLTRLAARVQGVLGVEVALRELFEHPTPAALATVLEGRGRVERTTPLPPLERRAHSGERPTSSYQEAVWFIERLRPGTSVYTFAAELELRGRLDRRALERALSTIVERHEILRTTFPSTGERPVQRVHPPWEVRLPPVDPGGASGAARGATADEWVGRAAREPFALERLPLVRWHLLALGEQEHRLVHLQHHITHDGWSFGLLLGELETLYADFASGRAATVAPAPLQFGDFAEWQRGLVRDGTLEPQLAYWSERLRDVPDLAWTGAEDGAGAAASFASAALRRRVDAEPADELRALGRANGATLFMVMLAVHVVLVHERTGQHDFAVGAGIAGRRAHGSEEILGMVTNTVALRLGLSGDPSFAEVLERVRIAALEAYANQDVPFDEVVRRVAPSRSAGRLPVFQTIFSFHDAEKPALELPGLSTRLTELVDTGAAISELTVVAIPDAPAGGGVELVWEHSTEVFDPSEAAALGDRYLELVRSVLASPSARLSELTGQHPTAMLAPVPTHHPREATAATARSPVPPGTAVERLLLPVWEEALGVRGVGVEDDFFELGGHSLLAARLFAEVERRTGRRLALSTLFEAPTVRGLAAALASPGEDPGGTLVAVAPLGGLRPFFCVHPGGGEVLGYGLLARHLGDDRPFYALQPTEEDVEAAALVSIEEMAARYLEAIREVQPSGPYLLGGRCLGARVAYEMAQQLVRGGEEVAGLVMLDSGAPRLDRSDRSRTGRPSARKRFRRTRRRLAKLLTARRAALRARVIYAAHPNVRWAETLKRRHAEADGAYRASPYPGRLFLIRSAEFAGARRKDTHVSRWERLARGGVDVRVVAGRHHGMFIEPGVEATGAALRACLEQIDAAADGATGHDRGGNGHAPSG